MNWKIKNAKVSVQGYRKVGLNAAKIESKLVAEGEKGVLIVPEILSNSGGVTAKLF